MIASDRLLTAAHVVEGCGRVDVDFAGGVRVSGRVRVLVGMDAAVVMLDRPVSRRPLRWAVQPHAAGQPQPGTVLYALAIDPATGQIWATPGLVADARGPGVWLWVARAYPGASGGAVIDETGGVAGLIVHGFFAVRRADGEQADLVAAEPVRLMLPAVSPGWLEHRATAPLDETAMNTRATEAIGQVSC